jgi:hypothetical protein
MMSISYKIETVIQEGCLLKLKLVDLCQKEPDIAVMLVPYSFAP